MKLSKHVVQWLTSLRMNKFKGEPRPHKPVLLLSVLELAENGQLAHNEILFEPTLFEYFGECAAFSSRRISRTRKRLSKRSASSSGASIATRKSSLAV